MMKKFIAILFCLVTLSSIAQDDTTVYNNVEKMPEYPGGQQALMKYISNNVKYPAFARETGLAGKVFIKFVVYETGKVGSVSLERSSGSNDMDFEAVRVVSSLADFTPGMQNGRPVKVYFRLPISFVLDEVAYYYNTASKNREYNEIARLVFRGKAVDAYSKVSGTSYDGNDPDMHFIRAVLFYNNGRKKDACASLESALNAGVANWVHQTQANRAKQYICK